MKSYNHLYEKYISDENIELAIHNALKGKRRRRSVIKILSRPSFAEEIRHYARDFYNMPHKPKEIYDGIQRKKRTIIVPTFYEQVVHHMIVNILKPIMMKGMYEHSYGSVPGRGGHKGAKTIRKWISHGGKKCKYVLKMDIRKYFDSIPHDILLEKFRNLIHDARFMSVIEEVISVTDKGIPLGFYLSQWIANWYLQGLDHYIKEELHADYYMRYMDDMIVFGGNKRALHAIRVKVAEYLEKNLGLEMKDDWQIFRFEYNGRFRFLDYMGFRFYRNRVTLRKSIMLKASRKARKISAKEKPTIYDIRQMLSYLGWIMATDTYGFYAKWVKPFVNIQYCKRRISRYDKRQKGVNNGLVYFGITGNPCIA